MVFPYLNFLTRTNLSLQISNFVKFCSFLEERRKMIINPFIQVVVLNGKSKEKEERRMTDRLVMIKRIEDEISDGGGSSDADSNGETVMKMRRERNIGKNSWIRFGGRWVGRGWGSTRIQNFSGGHGPWLLE
ncbi:uncharacterized protein LOC143226377 [Tachypleus tridentatus]|uniref:uncharacterized protein LOC143226377 n=1 Tax=Tachypleus tridentatus TaxID=6853 RepID=UPI003FD2221D